MPNAVSIEELSKEAKARQKANQKENDQVSNLGQKAKAT